MKYFWLFFLFAGALCAEVDYDCIVVGTSPTSLFEAIYQTCLGKKVLVVEKATECGGAWKSITICGIEHADMGCHEFGNAERVKKFLEEYAGCTIVPNAPTHHSVRDNWGFYPSRGCYELIHNLELLMQKLGTVLLLNSSLESVFIDHARKIAEVRVNGVHLTTSKIIVTNGAEIILENPECRNFSSSPKKTRYPHLYLLISDPTASRFTYINTPNDKASRAMNMTRFVGLEGSGMQLIVFQVHNETFLGYGEHFLYQLKLKQLVDSNAKILQTDQYIYEQAVFNQTSLNQFPFEFIATGHIGLIDNFLPKWKRVLRPWKEIMATP